VAHTPIPLNALRAFEAAARHLSFTRAAQELCVTQAAVSHQVKALEARLGLTLFRRLPRGLALTDEGVALLAPVSDSFQRIGRMLERFEGGRLKEVLTVSVVGTFAAGWLLPRLQAFGEEHPFIDLRMLTNNNRVDLAAEGLDLAIRYGDGAWHGVEAEPLMDAPLTPLCSPELAARLGEPRDLLGQTLLRPYRGQDWLAWFDAAGLGAVAVRGPLFDSSWIMVEAAIQGLGVALAPAAMFRPALEAGRLVQPFAITTPGGRYWLTRLKSRTPSPAMQAFRDWALREAA
jgi:LysR family transcriptional regulator of beta-lactamase